MPEGWLSEPSLNSSFDSLTAWQRGRASVSHCNKELIRRGLNRHPLSILLIPQRVGLFMEHVIS